MRNRFDEQLELLNVELIRMGALCEDAISYASRTLMGEGDFAEEVYKVDHEIDQKELRYRESLHAAAFTAAAGGKGPAAGFFRVENDF